MSFDAGKRVHLHRDFWVSLVQAAAAPPARNAVIDFFTGYQQLNKSESLQLDRKLSKVMPADTRKRLMQVSNPFIRIGIEKGIKQGKAEEKMEVAQKLFSRNTPIDDIVEITGLPRKQIEQLCAEKSIKA
jgi:predicted transposase/invertase (TIGR01784 family)